MPRRSSVEKPAEDPNVEKRVTRGSARKSEGGSTAVATPDKQKEANTSKNSSPAKANSTPGKRGRPSKQNAAAAAEVENDKPEVVENADVLETKSHDKKPAETTTANEETDSGKKRSADNNGDESEEPAVKKPRSENEEAAEPKEAHAPAVAETTPTDVEKMETRDEPAKDDVDKSAAAKPDVPVVSNAGDAVNHSNDNTGSVPNVCSKSIPSEPAAGVAATTDEVIKENGCHEAGNNVAASDAC